MQKINFIYSFLIISVLGCISCHTEEFPEENLQVVMLQEVNKIRKKGCQCGLINMPPVKELIWNEQLESAALFHANDMVTKEYFSHISPEGSSPILRAHSAGYTGSYVSENIARGYSLTEQVMTEWIASESHCKNIMDSSHFEMGAAKSQDYWVQEFGGQ